jgi:hypothetical protein
MLRIGPFSVHSRLDSYTHDLSDPSSIPVLGDDNDRLGSLVEVIAQPPRRGPEVPGVLVVVPPGSGATVIGRALADRFAGRFAIAGPGEFSGVIEEDPGISHVVLLALTGELSIDVILGALTAMSDLRRHSRCQAGFGVVMGQTLGDLSWLVAKGLSCHLRAIPERAQLCVAPWGERSAGASPGVQWATGDGARRAVLRPMLCDQHNGLVSFASAGREHAMIIADTVVCGADADRRPLSPAPGAAAPSCAFSDQCFRDGVTVRDVIHASQIRADVVFANSCMSWRPGHGLVGPDYQLTNAFQRGIAAAFIGAIHQMVPDVKLNELVHRAAADGMCAGQLGVLLNDHVQASGKELPYFVVLGLPWVAPFAGPGRSASLGHGAGGSAHPTPGTADQADGGIRPGLRRIGQVIEALRDFPSLGFMPSGDLPAIDTEVSALVARLNGAHSLVRSAEASDDPLRKLRGLVEDAELNAAADFHDFGQVSDSALNEIWEDSLEPRMGPASGRCPYCGGCLAELTGQHPAYARVNRRALICHVCGPVYDLPAVPVIDPVSINCPALWERPGVVRVEVPIVPAAALSEEIVVAIAVHTSKAARRGISFPDPQRISLRPGWPALLRVDAELSDDAFLHHEHFVRAVLIAQGVVHYASRPVAVQPRR